MTLDSGEAIQAARDAYDKLTDTRKGLVTKLDTLITAETRYPELQEEEQKGYVAVAVEKFTIGQGYLVEPVLVEIQPGEDTTAEVLDALLTANGLR